MAFIGIIADNEKEESFESILKDLFLKSGQKHTAILINKKSVDNLKNVKFELILMDDCTMLKYKPMKLKNVLSNTQYLVINSDMCNMDIIKDINLTVISYGFNAKATITMSSISDENMLLCIQRSIRTIKNDIIEPQEVDIKKSYKPDEYLNMGASIIELLYK